MQTLKIRYYYPLKNLGTWLDYFSKTYPNLEYMFLREVIGWRFYNGVDYLADMNNIDVNDSVRQLRTSCHQLKAVHIIDNYWCHRTIEQLLKQDPASTFTELGIVGHLTLERQTLKALGTGAWDNLKTIAVYPYTKLGSFCLDDIIPVLQALRLEHLIFAKGDESICGPVCIDIILDNCRCLKELTIKNGYVTMSVGGEQHMLRSLTLDCVEFENNIFACLSYRCPQLRHLSMNVCTDGGTNVGRGMRISFPDSKFDTVHIQNMMPSHNQLSSVKSSQIDIGSAPLYKITRAGDDVKWVYLPQLAIRRYLRLYHKETTPLPIIQCLSDRPYLLNQENLPHISESIYSGIFDESTQRMNMRGWWEAEQYRGYVLFSCESVEQLYIHGKRVMLEN
ncbi:hypothetical protein DFQ30_009724 [Apophysomyces sp. BC1015]|nr:hypothetical protein DFQ30_009724 [Apophysomyces sp. BC1015]